MAAMCSAHRLRIGALVCVGVFVVLNIFFVSGYASHERPPTVGICLVDAVLLIVATTLYRRSRRPRPADPLCQHYQVN
jgi:lipopolysaccharide export LptBFGC system permease protein LptF